MSREVCDKRIGRGLRTIENERGLKIFRGGIHLCQGWNGWRKNNATLPEGLIRVVGKKAQRNETAERKRSNYLPFHSSISFLDSCLKGAMTIAGVHSLTQDSE